MAQIIDIYAECCIDYDRNSQVTKDFYSMIQNRFHYAITGHTAAEIVYANETIQNQTWALRHGRMLLMAEF